MEQQARETKEARQKELRKVKSQAESRERELRRTQASKLSETSDTAERRVASLQAQREADNRALRARHTEEIARLRREYEERLAAEDERRKLETWALEERLGEARIQRETEVRAYTARLAELEAARLSQKTLAEEDLERVVERFGEEISELEGRIIRLEESLEESERLRGEMESELANFRTRVESGELLRPNGAPREGRETEDEQDGRLRELDAERLLAEERISDLEARLREAQEESRQNARDLAEALEALERLSDPERRLRDGIALFNASDHARAVASISKALGLPRVYAGLHGEAPGKPILTFAWGDIAWRRYVSDPTEGVEEPRVYLTGTGDDPAEIEGALSSAAERRSAPSWLTSRLRRSQGGVLTSEALKGPKRADKRRPLGRSVLTSRRPKGGGVLRREACLSARRAALHAPVVGEERIPAAGSYVGRGQGDAEEEGGQEDGSRIVRAGKHCLPTSNVDDW
jgi:hypothetical protein